MRLAGEHLSIRVLQPACNDLFLGEIECMLQIQQSGDETRTQNRAARAGLKRHSGDAVDGRPIDYVGQLNERMVQVDMLPQRITLDIAVLENTAFRAHGSLHQFARKRPVILAIPANPSLTYLSEGPHGYWGFGIFQRRLSSFSPKRDAACCSIPGSLSHLHAGDKY